MASELERMLVCASTGHKTVDSRDEVVNIVARNPFFVDIARAVQSRNTVVLLGDDAIKTLNLVQSYRRCSCLRLSARDIFPLLQTDSGRAYVLFVIPLVRVFRRTRLTGSC